MIALYSIFDNLCYMLNASWLAKTMHCILRDQSSNFDTNNHMLKNMKK